MKNPPRCSAGAKRTLQPASGGFKSPYCWRGDRDQFACCFVDARPEMFGTEALGITLPEALLERNTFLALRSASARV